jgi:hypothetical protein
MTPSGLIGATIVRTHDSAGLPLPSSEQQRPALLVPAGLSVDADRDGDIDDIDPRLNSQTSPFWFAVNDDDDVDAAAEAATAGTDWQNGRVDGKDDLADFFPLFLDIKQLLGVLPHSASGLTYKFKQADGAVNVVFTSLTRETAFGYLDTASATTGYGPDFGQAAASATTQQVTASGLALPAAFLTRIRDEGQGVVLVEMRGLSSAPLRLVVENADGVEIAELALGLSSFRFHADAGKVHLGFDPPNKAEGDPANEYWASVVQGATNDILNLDMPAGALGGMQWRVTPADTARVGIAMPYGTTAKVTITGHNTGATEPEPAKIELIPFGRGGPAVLTLNVMVLPQREMKLAIYTLEDPDSPLSQFATTPTVDLPTNEEILAVCNEAYIQAGVRFVLHSSVLPPNTRSRFYPYDSRGVFISPGVARFDPSLPTRSCDGVMSYGEMRAMYYGASDAPEKTIFDVSSSSSEAIRFILVRQSGVSYANVAEDSDDHVLAPLVPDDVAKIRGLSSGELFAKDLKTPRQIALAIAHELGHMLGLATANELSGGGPFKTGRHDQPPYPAPVNLDDPNGQLPAHPGDDVAIARPVPNRALMQGGAPEADGLPWMHGHWMRNEDWERANEKGGTF